MEVSLKQNIQVEFLASDSVPWCKAHSEPVNLPFHFFRSISIILVCTRSVQDRCCRGCTSTTSMNCIVKHCEHYNMGVNYKHEIRTALLGKNFSLIVLPSTGFRMVTAKVNKYIFCLVSIDYTAAVLQSTSSNDHW